MNCCSIFFNSVSAGLWRPSTENCRVGLSVQPQHIRRLSTHTETSHKDIYSRPTIKTKGSTIRDDVKGHCCHKASLPPISSPARRMHHKRNSFAIFPWQNTLAHVKTLEDVYLQQFISLLVEWLGRYMGRVLQDARRVGLVGNIWCWRTEFAPRKGR